MALELPIPWVIALNACGIPVLQLVLAWMFSRLPSGWFDWKISPGVGGSVRWFERLLLIKRWKDLVPDGASWFRGGFAKASLRDKGPQHLRRFLAETRRAEACHWTALALTPAFFLWNPMWADLVMAMAILAANAPCIAIQRYNRIRLVRILAKSGQSRALAKSDVS
ncbi:glycosyl-4,4'-diaponeurosporenoate acyltransferase CrtO family protein [Luteolibacter soli]|uniref:Glycosyl-4,4'-diaponeurosporenoate acyltransferase n=1 Tax=Luteolibacter soli TaxID=3135280 RepID=A0ABU9B5E5_9BACT